MPRYIDEETRDTLLSAAHMTDLEDTIQRILDEVPTADVVPVVHAKWVKSELSRDRNVYICSRCARTVSTPLGVSFDVVLEENPYCHCGAKMDGENTND